MTAGKRLVWLAVHIDAIVVFVSDEQVLTVRMSRGLGASSWLAIGKLMVSRVTASDDILCSIRWQISLTAMRPHSPKCF